MAGGHTITISHRPTPFRTCEGEVRLGSGLPNLSACGLPDLQAPDERSTKCAVSIGGDPIATGSFSARRYGVADDPQDQIVTAQSLPHLLTSSVVRPNAATQR